MLDNLLDNALVHGASEPVRVRLTSSDDEVSLEVHSAGAVADHVRKKLFRRFVTTRADRGGSGLGLAIVRAVAEAHGGSVACAEPGPPAVVFRVKLPTI
jgi:two-component system sensor histidine kinase CreC